MVLIQDAAVLTKVSAQDRDDCAQGGEAVECRHIHRYGESFLLTIEIVGEETEIYERQQKHALGVRN